MRLHAEWQNAGTSVPLLARDLVLFASDQDVALALEVSQGYVYHRHVADGLPLSNRYGFTDAHVWDESVHIPRHASPRPGPRRVELVPGC